MNSIGLGMHGTGIAGDNHAYAIAKTYKFSLVAVSDDQSSLSRSFALRHHVDKYYGDLEYLLADTNVDMVVVTSPTPLHASVFPYIAETGRSVIMETPIASTLEEAKEIIDKACDEGIFLFPVSQISSDPLMKLVFSFVRDNRLGRIIEYSFTWSFPSPQKRWMNRWGGRFKNREMDLFLQSASPLFDLVSSLFSEERVVLAKEINGGCEVFLEKGRLSITDGYDGFSFFIKGESGEIVGKNGRLISLKIDGEGTKGFDFETIKSPYSPLSLWYEDIYSALEKGVWTEEKYMISIKSMEIILESGKFFV